MTVNELIAMLQTRVDGSDYFGSAQVVLDVAGVSLPVVDVQFASPPGIAPLLCELQVVPPGVDAKYRAQLTY